MSNSPHDSGHLRSISRRGFIQLAAAAGGALSLRSLHAGADRGSAGAPLIETLPISALPKGGYPPALHFSHFPDRLHAYIWRNWMLVPVERLAEVVGTSPRQLIALARSMGLPRQPRISLAQQKRSYITVIRRNWHLLEYDQLLQLLDWTPEEMAFALREDDFLYVKLGNLKPKCGPLRFAPPSAEAAARARRMGGVLRENSLELGRASDPLFGFVQRLASKPTVNELGARPEAFSPRFCYSYFAVYGDPLLEEEVGAYPDGYLARLAAVGVDGVWLQGVLQKLSPFPWDNAISARYEARLGNLRKLVARAKAHGIGVYLYLNEPRSMPLGFFESRPALRGVPEGEHAALCTSHHEVQSWITRSVAIICRAVPDLAGFFTITASENLTNCWSHHRGQQCPRCAKRSPSDVIAEVNHLIEQGIREAGGRSRLIAWDWGWADDWAESIINQLPESVSLMSVSEWSIPIQRGGIENKVGEYSISTVGPGPRAQRHWNWARKRGLRTLAKVQAGVTWELSAVPYIPALENVAQHAANLLSANVNGLMLGWTLGGFPSPNLEIFMEVARFAQEQRARLSLPRDAARLVGEALDRVAGRRFGPEIAPAVVRAWREMSKAFSEFPYDGGVVYHAPMQYGPSNLLFERPTGYRSTMVGFPYDDLDQWRGPYPADIFIAQMQKVASGFESAVNALRAEITNRRRKIRREHQKNVSAELDVSEAAAIHFRSTANQARYVQLRRAVAQTQTEGENPQTLSEMKRLLNDEIQLARRLFEIQSRDSRIGFEASNQYYYVPVDLAEKVLNCRDLLERLKRPSDTHR